MYYTEERKKIKEINAVTEFYRDYYPYAAVTSAIIPGMSDDAIKKELNRQRLFYENEMRIMNKFSNHKPEFYGVDLSEILKTIMWSDKEHLIVVLFDIENKKIHDWKKVCTGNFNSTGPNTYTNMLKYVIGNIDDIIEKQLTVLTIHNHPLCVPANPAEQDKKVWNYMNTLLEKINIYNIKDHFVVTPYDVYSYNQDKKEKI